MHKVPTFYDIQVVSYFLKTKNALSKDNYVSDIVENLKKSHSPDNDDG